MAGGARIVGYRAERFKSRRMEDSALETRAAGHAGAGATRFAGGRRKSACAQWREWGGGALLQSLGMVTNDLRPCRAEGGGRPRRPGGAPGRVAIIWKGSFQREVSAHQFQPDRTKLHVGVWARDAHRDQSRDRRIADRKGVQRAGMRSGVGPRGRARTGAGRLRNERWLYVARDAAALRGRTRQREMEPRPIPRCARVGPAPTGARS